MGPSGSATALPEARQATQAQGESDSAAALLGLTSVDDTVCRMWPGVPEACAPTPSACSLQDPADRTDIFHGPCPKPGTSVC